MFRRLLLLSSLLALFTLRALAAQTVEEIVAKNLEARGGMESLKALETLKMTGTLITQGLEMPITLHRARPNLYHFTTTVQGMTIVQAFDGETAWWVHPMVGVTEPAPMPEVQARNVEAQSDVLGFLVDYRSKGHRVELLGKEKGQDRGQRGKVYKLKVTLKNGTELLLFLDAKDYLERRLVTKADLQGTGTETEVEVLYQDYKEVAGVFFAHRQITTSGGATQAEMVFDTVEVGVDIEQDLFLLPGQRADASLGLDEVLARHLKARGGAEATRGLSSLKATGKVVAMGFEVPMVVYFQRPNSFRANVDLQGLEMIMAFDGEMAWRVSPMEGITEPEEMPPDTGTAVAAFSDFVWGLLTAENRPAIIELVGVDKVERDEVYHVRLTTPSSGDVQEIYLGGEDFLERRLSFDAGGTTVETTLGDYRPVGETQLPHSIVSKGGSLEFEMKIEDVQVNTELDGALFRMPVKETVEEDPGR